MRAVGVDRSRLAELTHAEAPRERDPAVLDDTERYAGDPELLLPRLDETAELRQAGLVQPVRFLSGKRLALIPLRQQAAEDQRDLGAAFLANPPHS